MILTRPIGDESRCRLKRVYLDQCHWIRLEAAALGRAAASKRTAEVLELLRYGVDHSLVSLPLSGVHYMETYNRPFGRRTLATIMAELSRFHAIAGPPDVLPAELDAYLHGRYGKPFDPQPLRVFGRGWAFAMGVRHTPFRLSDDAPLTPVERSRFEAKAGDLLEFAMLAGPPDGVPIPGWAENDGYREFGERQVVHEQTLARQLVKAGPASTRRVHDWVAATELLRYRIPA